jgi:DNA-binding XRE family transcriptional regulator
MSGRPLKYKSVKSMQEDIDKYFAECDENGKPYTVSGLAYALGTNRQTLLNYEEKEEFFDTIKSAKAKIELFNEEMLYNKDVSTTGVIFNLKNNYGWKDKQEIEAEVNSDLTIKIDLVDD